jgi:hypothetical protein
MLCVRKHCVSPEKRLRCQAPVLNSRQPDCDEGLKGVLCSCDLVMTGTHGLSFADHLSLLFSLFLGHHKGNT